MLVELVELLRRREPWHPSRYTLLRSDCGSELQIEVTGYPWWLENPQPESNKKITFLIEGITDICLNSDIFDADLGEEDLESFDARPLSKHEWAKGAHGNIYCSAPLSNPMDVYVSAHDFLLSINCPYGPERYLNMGELGSLDEFVAIVSSNSFLLCSGPKMIRDKVCEVLEKQGSIFNVVKGKDLSNGLVCVQFSGSYIICRSAHAVFED